MTTTPHSSAGSAAPFSRIDRTLGAHTGKEKGIPGCRFGVWAPNAARVTVGGSFNGWDFESKPLTRGEDGCWYGFVTGISSGTEYQFLITDAEGNEQRKSDPCAYGAQVRPLQASKVVDLTYRWGDDNWLRWRKDWVKDFYARPMNIYEVHPGSWRRTADGGFLSYGELGRQLIPYAKSMGYTHIEFLPLMEHPLDESWGYQVTGYFAATSRFGSPTELKALIDACHQAGLGVILDWVPAHFPDDAFGLKRFDGTALYEYEDPRIGRHLRWGTNVFDFSRPEVCDFLLSSALFWAQEFHADGLRVDAVASMLYLDYDRSPGEWLPNPDGSNENHDAVAFLRRLNTVLHQECPDLLTIAEESSAWPHVTGPMLNEKALGFDLKWNMGWMNDSLRYQMTDPLYRGACHRDVTFPMMYAFSEHYVLPISHDEVVHLKGSLVGKMPGANDARKLANVRAFYLYQLTQPGKKLLMMGSEFSQFNEWNYDSSLDWHLLNYDAFRLQQEFFRTANQLYLSSPALWAQEADWSGFRWLEPDDANGNTLIYSRMAEGAETLLLVVNFSGLPHYSYPLGVPTPGTWEVLLSTDEERFGGSTKLLPPLHSVPVPKHGCPESAFLDLPACTAVLLHCTEAHEARVQPRRRFRR